MAYSISEEERAVLNDIKNDVHELSKLIKSSSALAVGFVLQAIVNYCSGLSDFALKNIRDKGFDTIIYQRALRFFKLKEVNERNSTRAKVIQILKMKNKSGGTSRKHGIPKFDSVMRAVLLPFYLLICSILWVRSKKMKKYVKRSKLNVYIDKEGIRIN